MKFKILQQRHRPTLSLIFGGWGMDENCLGNWEGENDLVYCYDYQDLRLDFDLNAYRRINVLAWSMGVWVANCCLQQQDNIGGCTAYNGTLFPIHDRMGIPLKVFSATADRLSPLHLRKFYIRMCGSPALYSHFEKYRPQRDFNDIHLELKRLQQMIFSQPDTPPLPWSKIIIGDSDLIFPARNQKLAWSQYEPITDHSAHFSPIIWNQLVLSCLNPIQPL